MLWKLIPGVARRFNYSQEFLQWALQPPGYQADWVLGVRVSSSGKLVAFITGVPATVRYWRAPLFMSAQSLQQPAHSGPYAPCIPS